ncbi:uncharacterized protein LOC124265433 [Haliotis rubra]|uniref:uncharacterized protein LOC124265433 n=1 Tax=Haliotis rubra TaxID=36100 RepID=UPI001EE50271|nr:uncharacterized protein LOC124265433 [Haliotis rubra]
MFCRLLISALIVALLGNLITSNRTDQSYRDNDQSYQDNDNGVRLMSKRAQESCVVQPCVQSVTEDAKTIPLVISSVVISLLILAGVGCLLWKKCLRNLRRGPTENRSSVHFRKNGKMKTPVKLASMTSMNLDLEHLPDNDLYSSESDDNDCFPEGVDLSMVDSYNMDPVASCSPYHLAWTTPKGIKTLTEGSSFREQEVCSCTVVNECDNRSLNRSHNRSLNRSYNRSLNGSLETEPTQIKKRQKSGDGDMSIASSTPYRTPKIGYAHGRPHPTPIERLTSIKPGVGAGNKLPFSPSRPDFPVTPVTLFLEKRRFSAHTPARRLLEIQPRGYQGSDDASRMDDSLLWDSYPFRPQEESLVWDDDIFESESKSLSKVDENCNDPNFISLEI